LIKAKEKALRTVAMHPESALPGVLTMDESPQDGVQNLIEMFAHIFRQESQHEKSVLLQQGVFPPVPPVRFGISQMLCAVQFNYDAGFLGQALARHVATLLSNVESAY